MHLSERAGRYLQIVGGEPTHNLLKVARQDLRLELRTALFQAVQRRANVSVENVPVSVEDQTEIINLHVRPSLRQDNAAHGFILIVFEASKANRDDAPENIIRAQEPIARQLEEELMRTRTQLRMTTDQFDVRTEEYKASNEELQAMNEELRLAAEELETSKEELQSLNEELQTVNQELKIKIEEISQSNDDFRNLIDSTDIGTIFLDRSLRVNLFSPAVRDIFNLIPTDIGRSLSDITSRLENQDLLEEAEQVLENLRTIEREVPTVDGRVFMMRMMPYRTTDNRISGIVITFVDLTRRKQAERELQISEERGRRLIESATDHAIFTIDDAGAIDSWNSGAETIFGYREAEIIGEPVAILFTPEDRIEGVPAREMTRARAGGRGDDERWHLRKDGSRFYATGAMTRMQTGSANSTGGFVKIARDMTTGRKM